MGQADFQRTFLAESLSPIGASYLCALGWSLEGEAIGSQFLRSRRDIGAGRARGLATLDRRTRATRGKLRIATVAWIERTYHRCRRQAALGRFTPIEYELITTTTATNAAQLERFPVRAAFPAALTPR